jgi:hypothetical protein
MTGPMDRLDEAVGTVKVARLQQPDALRAFQPALGGAAVAEARVELKGLQDRHKELERKAARPDGPSVALVAAAERGLMPRIEKGSGSAEGARDAAGAPRLWPLPTWLSGGRSIPWRRPAAAPTTTWRRSLPG